MLFFDEIVLAQKQRLLRYIVYFNNKIDDLLYIKQLYMKIDILYAGIHCIIALIIRLSA